MDVIDVRQFGDIELVTHAFVPKSSANHFVNYLVTNKKSIG